MFRISRRNREIVTFSRRRDIIRVDFFLVYVARNDFFLNTRFIISSIVVDDKRWEKIKEFFRRESEEKLFESMIDASRIVIAIITFDGLIINIHNARFV